MLQFRNKIILTRYYALGYLRGLFLAYNIFLNYITLASGKFHPIPPNNNFGLIG